MALFLGAFHSKKIPVSHFHMPNGKVHSGCTDPTGGHRAFGYCSCKQGYKRAVLGTTILPNGKRDFGPTDRNDQTGQRGPPSKLVPNIPVGQNGNVPYHFMYQPKFPEFLVEWKALSVLPCPPRFYCT